MNKLSPVKKLSISAKTDKHIDPLVPELLITACGDLHTHARPFLVKDNTVNT